MIDGVERTGGGRLLSRTLSPLTSWAAGWDPETDTIHLVQYNVDDWYEAIRTDVEPVDGALSVLLQTGMTPVFGYVLNGHEIIKTWSVTGLFDPLVFTHLAANVILMMRLVEWNFEIREVFETDTDSLIYRFFLKHVSVYWDHRQWSLNQIADFNDLEAQGWEDEDLEEVDAEVRPWWEASNCGDTDAASCQLPVFNTMCVPCRTEFTQREECYLYLCGHAGCTGCFPQLADYPKCITCMSSHVVDAQRTVFVQESFDHVIIEKI